MTWQAASVALLGVALAGGFAWYERERPPARVVAVVAALAALAVVGRLAFAAIPNVKPTTDIVLFAGYALGAIPGFAVGAVTAIVSNIFLSQGPWTVWQMAGWGAVGVAGALLARALRGREPNRFALAAVCGFAGLAFGAWMDVYQWTLAARQDIDTYVAVAGTSLPYNLAHAAGNVVFCLLIGPAFLRALARYRRRLEVRWERSPAPVALGAVAVALLLLVPAAAVAATPAQRARSYLAKAQNEDGGLGATPGAGSSPLYTGWAGLGLGSAGRNPRDVMRPGGRSLARYVLRRSGSLRDIGEIERTVLVAHVAGLSPRSFGGRDLLAEIEGRRRHDGSISGFVSYTAFGVMALRAGGASAGGSTIQWLVHSQNSDGGFGVARSSASDADMTGAVLQALASVGRGGGSAARRAVGWLRANQNGDGGFGQVKGRLERPVDRLRGPGTARRARARQCRLARAQLSDPAAARQRERGLLLVVQPDARLGYRAGADGARGQAAPAGHRAAQEAPSRGRQLRAGRRGRGREGERRQGQGRRRGEGRRRRRCSGRRGRRRGGGRRRGRRGRHRRADPGVRGHDRSDARAEGGHAGRDGEPGAGARLGRDPRSARPDRAGLAAAPLRAAASRRLGLVSAWHSAPRCAQPRSARAIMRSIRRSGSTFAIRARSFASLPTR